MKIEDEMEWNSSMMRDGVIVGTMDYMFKKGHTLQEANYVLFNDDDTGYAPILKAMSNVNGTHPDIILKEMAPQDQQQQQQFQQQQQQQQQQVGTPLAATGGATQFGGNAPRGVMRDASQRYDRTSPRDMRRQGGADRAEIKQGRKTQNLQDRADAGQPITAGEYAGAAGAAGKRMAGQAGAAGKRMAGQAAGATKDFMSNAGPAMAAGAGKARAAGSKALGGARDFMRDRMGRDADGEAKPGMLGRMGEAGRSMGAAVRHGPKAWAENRQAKRGRVSNEGAMGQSQDDIRRFKNTMHSGGSEEQQAELAGMQEDQQGIQDKLNDPNAKMSFRDRVKQIGARGAEEAPAEEEGAEEEEAPAEEEGPHNTETQVPTPEAAPQVPEGDMPTPEAPNPIPSPADSVEGGAEPAAVEAAQEDKAPEPDYGNYAGEGHDGPKEFGAKGSTRQGTSRSIVDAMRDYKGDNMEELSQAVRDIPTKSGGKRRLTDYQKRMLQQHAQRRGFGGEEAPHNTETPAGEEEGPHNTEAPAAEEEGPHNTEIDPQQEDFNRRTDTDDDDDDDDDGKGFLQNFSEDALDSAWDALTVLKHR